MWGGGCSITNKLVSFEFFKAYNFRVGSTFGIDFPVMSHMDQLSMHYPQSFKPLQVFGFARSNQSNYSPHRADCHVCECSLEFRTKVEVKAVCLYLHVKGCVFAC